MDSQKASDKVPHKRLLTKVKSYGLDDRVVTWIQDFMHNRTQQLGVDGVISVWKPVISGVPQGSILGPVLFVLYMNDVPSLIQSDLYLFADDAKIFRTITGDIDSCVRIKKIKATHRWKKK